LRVVVPFPHQARRVLTLDDLILPVVPQPRGQLKQQRPLQAGPHFPYREVGEVTGVGVMKLPGPLQRCPWQSRRVGWVRPTPNSRRSVAEPQAVPSALTHRYSLILQKTST
jgi:hypothetical protein